MNSERIITADQRDITILKPSSMRSLQDLNTTSLKKTHKVILTKLSARNHKVFPPILPKGRTSFIKMQTSIP